MLPTIRRRTWITLATPPRPRARPGSRSLWPIPSTFLGSRTRIQPFHATPRNQGGPLVPLLVMTLKASTSLEIIRTAGRVVLTFLPVLWLHNIKSRKHLRFKEMSGNPESAERTSNVMRKIRNRTVLFHVLLFIPIGLFWATFLASLERTPLTGRWRLIILSPEEEDDIAAQLAGTGWYTAVNEILTEDGPAMIIPPTDWRYEWVRVTLRKLEQAIPVLQSETSSDWIHRDPTESPLPPPAEYPLKPRPRAADSLRQICNMMCKKREQPAPHAVLGPPYSLLLVDKPDASNAFSYGFGPNGGGGIVVYSGFLNDVLSRAPMTPPPPEPPRSWFSSIFFPSPPRSPSPTPEQTSELAILLAHELSHLVLSHHLESLSSGTVFIPGSLSLLSDIIRVLLFPITMLFGPFVNDAVAQLGKIGTHEVLKISEQCTSVVQEIEADVVSARLLAHAGFDARSAIQFWENRHDSECVAKPSNEEPSALSSPMIRRIMGSGHPVSEVRVDKLKGELVRWEIERRAAIHKAAIGPQKLNVSMLSA